MLDITNPQAFAVDINPRNPGAEAVASFVNQTIARHTDPASKSSGSPPLWGEDVVPHVMTFASLVGTFSRAYQQSDEALQDSWENARLMRNDVGLMECVEARQRMVSRLTCSIEPEDDKHEGQLSLARELERILKRIRYFTKYKMSLTDAIWYGRAGIQNSYGWQTINGKQRLMPKPRCQDHAGWLPIHGDKIVYRYDDGNLDRSAGQYAHQMGLRTNIWNGNNLKSIHRANNPEPTGESIVQFLTPTERMVCCVHKHLIQDADYYDPQYAGSIHGVGIRSQIYWEWTLLQETLAFLMEYLERSAGGIEVWTYPTGDVKALAKLKEASNERMANGKNVLFFPKPLGDDTSAYNLEIVEPGFAGAEILQNLVQEYFGHRIKRRVLGQTLSSEAAATGLGSGVAEAHMDTLGQIIGFDAENLQDTMTFELVKVIQQINFPETSGWHMQLRLETEEDDALETLQAYQIGWAMGANIPTRDVMKAMGLGVASADEEVLSNGTMGGGGMAPGIVQDGDGDGIAGEGQQIGQGGVEDVAEQAEFVQQYSRDPEAKQIAKAVFWHRDQFQKAENASHRQEIRRSLKPLRKKLKEAFQKEMIQRGGKQFRGMKLK